MAGKVSFCYNHPTSVSRRKCFHCGKPLCPECQIRLSRHIFCGEKCHKLYKRQLFFDRLKEITGLTIWKTVFYAAAFVILIIMGVVYFTTKEVPFQTPQTENPKPEGMKADWASAGDIAITSPGYGEITEVNPITMEGKAPEGSIVGLYLNSDLIGLTLCRDGEFSFSDIKLPDESNILQARYFDDYGNNHFSGAILVTYRGREYQKPEVIIKEEKIFMAQGTPDNIVRVSGNTDNVYFTFDGGSSDKGTADLLNLLAEKKLKCTIFLTGAFIEKYPDLTRRIVQDGHEVGNHSYSHPHLTTYYGNRRHNTLNGVTREYVREQLSKTAELFKEVTGTEMIPLWRAPYGEHNREIRAWAEELGYKHIYWSIDSLDWVADKNLDIYYSPAQIRARIMDFSRKDPRRGGEIVLMHLSTERNAQDNILQILPDVIDDLRAKGYTFDKISNAL